MQTMCIFVIWIPVMWTDFLQYIHNVIKVSHMHRMKSIHSDSVWNWYGISWRSVKLHKYETNITKTRGVNNLTKEATDINELWLMIND